MRRDDIIAAARGLIGTPFAHQGRTPGVAMDCGGVVVHLLGLMGIAYDVDGYSRLPDGDSLIRVVDGALERIARDAYRPADVVAVRISRHPQHLALVTDYGLLHAWQRVWSPASVVEHTLTDDWRARIVAAWQFPGVID